MLAPAVFVGVRVGDCVGTGQPTTTVLVDAKLLLKSLSGIVCPLFTQAPLPNGWKFTHGLSTCTTMVIVAEPACGMEAPVQVTLPKLSAPQTNPASPAALTKVKPICLYEGSPPPSPATPQPFRDSTR